MNLSVFGPSNYILLLLRRKVWLIIACVLVAAIAGAVSYHSQSVN